MKRMLVFAALLIALPASAANLVDGLKKGTVAPKAVGAMCFGPEGILFLADTKGMEVFAVATGDTTPAGKEAIKVEGLDGKIAALLGTDAKGISIRDMKVNPASGNIYLSVMRGTSPIVGSQSYYEPPARGRVRDSKNFHPLVDAMRRRADVDEYDLVLRVQNDPAQDLAQRDQLAAVKLAQEHAVLHVIAEVLERLEDACATVVVGDVVGDDEVVAAGRAAHRVTRPT